MQLRERIAPLHEACPMKLSIVTTLYKSAPYIEEFHRRISAATLAITDDYEIIYVNDGSPDDSLTRARNLADPKAVIIDLSRNFGHHKAMMTGLMHSKGDFVFLIDSDLEEQPELLAEFWHAQAQDAATDVFYGVQRLRKGGAFERLSGSLYYTVFNALSSIKIDRNMSVVRLMTRRYVDQLIQHREHELVFVGLAALTGYQQKPIIIDKVSKGETSYGLLRKLDMVANSVVAFSNRPLVFIFYLGLTITMLAMLFVAYNIFHYFVSGTGVSGYTSLIVSVWVLGGLILSSLGVIGIYLAKMFIEIKDRPYTIVRDIHRGGV
jgi:putative glycosyltransferase